MTINGRNRLVTRVTGYWTVTHRTAFAVGIQPYRYSGSPKLVFVYTASRTHTVLGAIRPRQSSPAKAKYGRSPKTAANPPSLRAGMLPRRWTARTRPGGAGT